MKAHIWMIAGAALIGVGSFAPWASLGVFSVSGTTGGGDGWLTLGTAIVILIVGVSLLSRGEISIVAKVIGGLAAISAGGIAIYDLININDLIRQSSGSLFSPSIGPGLPLVIVGAVAALVGAVAAPLGFRYSQPANVEAMDWTPTRTHWTVDTAVTSKDILARLDDLRDQGLITDDEYATKRRHIIDDI